MKRILVTDDNSDYRHSILELLQIEGFEVLDAPNGEEALALIHTEKPDLILCDIDMPIMNGFEVLQAVRAAPETAHIPFILVSGHMDAESIKRGDELGATDYIIKPMRFEVLLLKLRQHLDLT